MVLQDKYARAASRRYQKTHAPTPEEAAEHAAVDAAIKEVEKRRLGTNADRYKEDDEEAARAEGRLVGPDGRPAPPADEEVDEEEELRKAEEQAELEAFLERQRERLASPQGQNATGFAAPGDQAEDDEDVDHSFAHLRIGGAGKGRPRPPANAQPVPTTEEEREELRRMQDEARHRQAVRDLKDRFAGVSTRPAATASPRPAGSGSRPLPSGLGASGAQPRSPAPPRVGGFVLIPSKPGVQPAAKGQDFLDTLL
ncbi:hypothetical protein JCM10908_004343 [Rhodotorula pacifica]|uniref:uncharacterized protein n=1 Tax=Rhodotorula pacifica TaxID=1495444 RepID=UPI00317EADD8